MEQTRLHWRVRDTIYSAWRELPGEFTPQEIWRMRQGRTFVFAQPIDGDASTAALAGVQLTDSGK